MALPSDLSRRRRPRPADRGAGTATFRLDPTVVSDFSARASQRSRRSGEAVVQRLLPPEPHCLDPSVVTIHGHKYAKVTNVLLFFNATSASTLTTAFAVGPALGDPFGSVTLLARLK